MNHDHDHDHDHDASDPPGDETEDETEDEDGTKVEIEPRHHERLAAALGSLSDERLRSLLGAMRRHSRADLATQLGLPQQTAHLGAALTPLLRRKLSSVSDEKRVVAGFSLAEACNDETIATLGERHDDPTRDDMLEVLPPVVERHGADVVTLMLATYAASDAPCREIFAELLDTDERFAIDPAAATRAAEAADTQPPPIAAPPRTAPDEAERDALREQRRAAKAARRDAAQKQRIALAAAQAKRKEARHRAKRGKRGKS